MNLPMNIYWACLSVTLAVALARGGRPEQAAAFMLVVLAAASIAAAPDMYTSFRSVEWDMLAVDGAGFLGFLLLSLYANRWWPMCIAGMRVLSIGGHVAKIAAPEISRPVYMWMEGAWSYPSLLVIAIGIARHQHRLRRHGEDRCWRQSDGGAGQG